MGKHDWGQWYDNGERLCEINGMNELMIPETLFKFACIVCNCIGTIIKLPSQNDTQDDMDIPDIATRNHVDHISLA